MVADTKQQTLPETDPPPDPDADAASESTRDELMALSPGQLLMEPEGESEDDDGAGESAADADAGAADDAPADDDGAATTDADQSDGGEGAQEAEDGETEGPPDLNVAFNHVQLVVNDPNALTEVPEHLRAAVGAQANAIRDFATTQQTAGYQQGLAHGARLHELNELYDQDRKTFDEEVAEHEGEEQAFLQWKANLAGAKGQEPAGASSPLEDAAKAEFAKLPAGGPGALRIQAKAAQGTYTGATGLAALSADVATELTAAATAPSKAEEQATKRQAAAKRRDALPKPEVNGGGTGMPAGQLTRKQLMSTPNSDLLG